MRKLTTRSAAVLALFAIVLFVSCGTDSPASKPGNSDVFVPTINPQTITLEEIIERTRTAMLGITSFRSFTTLESKYSGDATTSGATFTIEWVAPDTTRIITDGTNENGENSRSERITFPTEEYSLENESGWKRRLIDNRLPSAFSLPKSLIFALHAPDISLVSKGDTSENGRPVYSIETFCVVSPTADSECLPDDDYDLDVFTHTVLLIDQETFRIVQLFVTVEYGRGSDSDPEPVSPPGSETQEPEFDGQSPVGINEPFRIKTEISASYYDYNEPISIEAPDEYEDWDGIIITETIVITARVDELPHTPTPVASASCSESGAIWPGCRVENAADASVMLSTFPDEYKLFVGDDVAITFAFDRQPSVDRTIGATFWYLPDGSRLEYCTSPTDAATSNALAKGVTSIYTYDNDNYSVQARLRIEEVLRDSFLMNEVNSRINQLENRCGQPD